MNRNHILIIVAVGVVCLAAGYWLALPAKKVIAPEVVGVSANIISIRDVTSSQLYKVAGEYPQFSNASPAFNTAIANFVNSNLAQFKSDSIANEKAREATAPKGNKTYQLPPQSFTFAASWEPEQINNRYISVIVRLDYYNGGANGNSLLKTFNYDVTAKKVMTLADLFPNVPNYLQQISSFAIQELTNSQNSASGGHAQLDMIQEGAAPTTDNYANFTFNDDIVTIYFPKYQVAPGVFGEQKVIITRLVVR